MPVFVAILIILLFTGGIQSSKTSTRPVDESDVIISTLSGGLARNVEEGTSNSYTAPVSVSDPSAPGSNENITSNQSVNEPVTATRVEIEPILDTLSARNLKTNYATLRGEIDFIEEPYPGKLYFVYSDDISEIRSLSSNIAETPVSGSARADGVYTRNVYGLDDDTTYYYRVCFDASQTTCGDVVSFSTVESYGSNSSSSYRPPTASTRRAEQIQGEYATLVGSYRLNDGEYTTAFFVYGEDWDLVSEIPDRYDIYSDIREADEDLQKVRVKSNMIEDGEFEKEIDELETSTTYYYRFCIAFDDDEKTGMTCGAVSTFETKSRQKDLPEVVSSQGARAGNNASLSTFINMGDYRDGHAFVVYGTSQNRVEAVADSSEFSRISQRGDELQRLSINDNFDSTDTVFVTLLDLLNASPYYFRFCVEYEAENDYGNDDLFLACGEVKTF